MIKTSTVFTPSKTPSVTSVTRDAIWSRLNELSDDGGKFVSVLGTTKLGKTTLVKSTLENAIFGAYIPGQNLASNGSAALWARLVDDLELPSSTQTGRVTGDKSKWGFLGRLGISIPGLSATTGASVGGEHTDEQSNSRNYDMDPAKAVAEGIRALVIASAEVDRHAPIVAIDDFHFITDENIRREIILALRPLADEGATVLLATLPGRETDAGFAGTNIGGRHEVVDVPRWTNEELRKIASQGLPLLNLQAPTNVIEELVAQSYGSPQIMQELCLKLCRTHGVKNDLSTVRELTSPANMEEFFRSVKDPQSVGWINNLGIGLVSRRPRTRYSLPDGRSLDGYQLILNALHELGAPSEVPFKVIKDQIQKSLGTSKAAVTKMNLETKALNMNVVASRDMTAALEVRERMDDLSTEQLMELPEEALFTAEEVQLAVRMPQPPFEVIGKGAAMKIRILDPLLSYTLRWHPEEFDRTPAS